MSEWGNKKMFGVCGLGGGDAEAGPRQSPGQGPGGKDFIWESLNFALNHSMFS